jgi:hypothetical protein
LQKLKSLEKHLTHCADARNIGDWKSVVSESDAAMAIGADSSPQVESLATDLSFFIFYFFLIDVEQSIKLVTY